MTSAAETGDKVMTEEPTPEPANQRMDRDGASEDIDSDVEQERRDRLMRKAMQLSDDISELYEIVHLKEKELTHIKQELGVTFYDELKLTMGSSFKTVSEKWQELKSSDTYRNTGDTLSGWRDKVTQSDSYKKTVSTISTTGEKATQGLQTATTRTGEVFKRAGESIIENETLQAAWARMVNLKDSFAQQLSPTEEQTGEGPEAHPEQENLIPDEKTNKDGN